MKRLQEIVRDVTEVTKLLIDITKKDNACYVEKEQKKIEKKLNPYHIDHIQISALDNVIESHAESDEENQHENNKKSINKIKEDTKRASVCTIEIDKDHSLKL